MKFALAAALIGAISAQACNNSLEARFYNDAACTKKNAALTQKHGSPPPEFKKFADGKCHSQG